MSLRARIEQRLIPSTVPSLPDVFVYLLLTNKIPEVGYFIMMFVHGFGGADVWHWCQLLLSLEREGWRDGEGERGAHINSLITIPLPCIPA